MLHKVRTVCAWCVDEVLSCLRLKINVASTPTTCHEPSVYFMLIGIEVLFYCSYYGSLFLSCASAKCCEIKGIKDQLWLAGWIETVDTVSHPIIKFFGVAHKKLLKNKIRKVKYISQLRATSLSRD